MENTIITVALTLVLLIVGILYARTLTLDQIRGAVYNAMVCAEHEYQHGQNKEKLDHCVQVARLTLESLPIPVVFKTIILMFLTTETLEKVIDAWFQQVKHLVQTD